MCKFFSFCSDEGKPLFFNAEQRKKILENIGEFENLTSDSHTSIAHYYGYLGEREDLLGKYEYNPLTKQFTVDHVGKIDNSKEMEQWVKNLDFKSIIPELIIKPIVNPFTIEPIKIRKEQIKLLKQWASVRDSVWKSVWNSVWNSVGDSIRDSVWDLIRNSIRDSVWDLVRDPVWASVWNSVKDPVWDLVWDSVKDPVWDSVWASVGAYCSSFFNIKFIYDFSSAIKLWEQGLIPCTDGEFWYLISKNGIEWKGRV